MGMNLVPLTVPMTATVRKYIILWSRDLIYINLHMIKNVFFVVDTLVVLFPLEIKSCGSPDNFDIKITKIGSLSTEM